MTQFFNHNRLRAMIAKTEHLEPFRVTRDGYLTGGPDGDEKLILRMVLTSEAAKRGAYGLTPVEGLDLVQRICQLPDIEHAALKLQQENARLRKALAPVLAALTTKKIPADREVAALAQLAREQV